MSSSVFSRDINKARTHPLVIDFLTKPVTVEKVWKMFQHENKDEEALA